MNVQRVHKSHKGSYRVYERPLPQDPTRGWRKVNGGDWEGTHVATVDGATLHRRMIDAIATSLDQGTFAKIVDSVGAGIAPTRDPSETQLAIESTRISIKKEENLYEQARATANETSHPRLKADAINDAEQALRRIEQLEDELDDLTRDAATPSPQEAVHEVGQFLQPLVELLNGHTTPELHQALATMLDDWQIIAVNPLHVTYRVNILLPIEGKAPARLGPITWTVENSGRLTRPHDRALAIADLCLTAGHTATQASAGIPGLSTPYGRYSITAAIKTRLREHGIQPKAATVAAGSEAPEVLSVLAAHLGIMPNHHVEPALAQRIIDTYAVGVPPGPKAWNQSRYRTPLAGVMHSLQSGGPRTLGQIQRANTSVKPHHIQRWIEEGYLINTRTGISIPTCQCGSTNLGVLATPEARGPICKDCHTDASGIRFPNSYLPFVA